MTRRVLPNRLAPEMHVYAEDFDDVADRFKGIVASASWIAQPGAVMDTVVPTAASYDPLIMTADQLCGYRTDTGDVIYEEKMIIGGAISAFEKRDVPLNEFTMAPGVSSALMCVTSYLKYLGVSEVIFELPSYFASIEQAELLGLNVGLFPSSPRNGYRITANDISLIDRLSSDPIALIVTQPRYGIGYNRSPEEIENLRTALRPGDILVIDEAADQSVPSPLGSINLDGPVRIIRVRGLTKGLGLNSAKVAAILHPASARSYFSEIVDVIGCALDAAALRVITDLARRPQRYLDLLFSAQSFVIEQYNTLRRATSGLPVSLAPIESGYLATAYFPNTNGGDFEEFRSNFLEVAVNIQLPIVRGSSLYFPYDGTGEIIRINYFTTRENIIASGRAFETLLTSLA
ncbi:aminotransferase class I/II-fold pyridoxal phosphate-dependent enzyme [Pleomorphomonas sp. NRK KF1]|uniref:aminotransferase class I/II-fold pyridoxal phosphate-dependent enzyme n=1 Tax=Pleomorphomonas sp. NRK KF1 TaxID=2943000 RepID=UPI002043D0C4|nr:aminotransferase class I/II-fold pyridoxal phosphate-dependent enzyme [Pleomorphomonas sp. NRK KF1]MCM5554141.1 hypothetical protein [Pleomorphomonas sp. NRK KF1]